VRVCQNLETTATFRPRKIELARQGFDPQATCDSLYFDGSSAKKFVPLDDAAHARIRSGLIRL